MRPRIVSLLYEIIRLNGHVPLLFCIRLYTRVHIHLPLDLAGPISADGGGPNKKIEERGLFGP